MHVRKTAPSNGYKTSTVHSGRLLFNKGAIRFNTKNSVIQNSKLFKERSAKMVIKMLANAFGVCTRENITTLKATLGGK